MFRNFEPHGFIIRKTLSKHVEDVKNPVKALILKVCVDLFCVGEGVNVPLYFEVACSRHMFLFIS